MTWPPDVATFILERVNAIRHTGTFPPVESRILRDEAMRFVQDGQRTQRRAAMLHERARLARQGLSRSQNLPAMHANERSMSRADAALDRRPPAHQPRRSCQPRSTGANPRRDWRRV